MESDYVPSGSDSERDSTEQSTPPLKKAKHTTKRRRNSSASKSSQQEEASVQEQAVKSACDKFLREVDSSHTQSLFADVSRSTSEYTRRLKDSYPDQEAEQYHGITLKHLSRLQKSMLSGIRAVAKDMVTLRSEVAQIRSTVMLTHQQQSSAAVLQEMAAVSGQLQISAAGQPPVQMSFEKAADEIGITTQFKFEFWKATINKGLITGSPDMIAHLKKEMDACNADAVLPANLKKFERVKADPKEALDIATNATLEYMKAKALDSNLLGDTTEQAVEFWTVKDIKVTLRNVKTALRKKYIDIKWSNIASDESTTAGSKKVPRMSTADTARQDQQDEDEMYGPLATELKEATVEKDQKKKGKTTSKKKKAKKSKGKEKESEVEVSGEDDHDGHNEEDAAKVSGRQTRGSTQRQT